MITLQVLTGAQSGTQFVIPERGASLGRSKMADFKLDDGLLSRLHCSFSIADGQAYVQDLNSSNGTRLNGIDLDDKPHLLQAGDVVTVGDTALRVSIEGVAAATPTPPVAPPPSAPTENLFAMPQAPLETPPTPPPASAPTPPPSLFADEATPTPAPETSTAESLDLGLGEKSETTEKKKSPAVYGLITALGAILVLLLGIVGVMHFTEETEAPAPLKQLADDSKHPFEFAYERLKIDDNALFRYTLTYASTGELALSITDLGNGDRSFTEAQKLSTQAQDDLRKLLLNANYEAIPKMYALQSNDGSLLRKKLTIVYGAGVWTRTAENDPGATRFHALCDELEAFARLKLGVVATQYSVEELTELARDKLRIARTAWMERDLAPNRLYDATRAYLEGIQLLRTLNPKPDFATELNNGLIEAEALLEERYEQAHFGVQKALETRQYDNAQANLQAILRMIPDRDDQRNIDATRELLRVESMMKNRRP